jgi:hypothetical protein
MDWFSVVSTLLFVPPIAIWISELALDSRGVDVASVLSNVSQSLSMRGARSTDHARILDVCLCVTPSVITPSQHARIHAIDTTDQFRIGYFTLCLRLCLGQETSLLRECHCLYWASSNWKRSSERTCGGNTPGEHLGIELATLEISHRNLHGERTFTVVSAMN